MTATLTLNSKTLRDGIDRVRHAAAADEARPILAAIVIEAHERGIRLVAADNYRIATLVIDVPPEEFDREAWPRAILPVRELGLIRLLLGLTGKHLPVELEQPRDNVLSVRTAMGAVELRLIDGTYPDVDKVTSQVQGEVIVDVNPRYLAEIAKGAAGAPHVGIRHLNAWSPLVFVAGDDYVETLMPVLSPETYRARAEAIAQASLASDPAAADAVAEPAPAEPAPAEVPA